MDGDFYADETSPEISTDSESVIGMWENDDALQREEETFRRTSSHTLPQTEHINLLDLGLSHDDKDELKSDQNDDQPSGRSKWLKEKPKSDPNHDKTSGRSKWIREKPKSDSCDKKPEDTKAEEEKADDTKTKNDKPKSSNPWRSLESYRAMMKEVREKGEKVQNPGGYGHQSPFQNSKESSQGRSTTELRPKRHTTRHVTRHPQAPPPPVPKEVANAVWNAIDNEVPEVFLDKDGYPPCMPHDIKQKRQSVEVFQARFNRDWARSVYERREHPLVDILMKHNAAFMDPRQFPDEIYGVQVFDEDQNADVDGIMNFMRTLDPEKIYELARDVNLTKYKLSDFDIHRDPVEQNFEKIIAEEDIKYGTNPNMSPEIRQQRKRAVDFQNLDTFDDAFCRSVRINRQDPLLSVVSKFTGANYYDLQEKYPNLRCAHRFKSAKEIRSFLERLDPKSVSMLAENPDLSYDPSFMNDHFILRDELERRFEEYEQLERNNILGQIYMEEMGQEPPPALLGHPPQDPLIQSLAGPQLVPPLPPQGCPHHMKEIMANPGFMEPAPTELPRRPSLLPPIQENLGRRRPPTACGQKNKSSRRPST